MADERSSTPPDSLAVAAPSPEMSQRPEVVFCPRCGRRNDRGEIYCQVCALPLELMAGCPHCAVAIPANAAYCPACGRRPR